MKRVFANINMSTIIYTLLFSGIISIVATGYINESKGRIHKTQDLLSNHTLETKTFLKETNYKIIADDALTQNLEWELNNSTNKSLSTYLKKSKIEHILVTKSNCEIISSASLNAFPYAKCEDLKLTNGYHWYTKNNVPVLALIQPIQNGGYFIISQLAFNQNWINQSPKLAQLWKELNIEYTLAFNEIFEKPFLMEGPGSRETHLYPEIKHSVLKLLPGNISESHTKMLLPVILILLSIFLMYTTKFLQIFQKNQDKEKLVELINWIDTNIDPNETTFAIKLENLNTDMIEACKSKVLQQQANFHKVKTQLEQQLEQKNLDYQKLNDKKEELETTIASITDQESIHAQLHQMSKKLWDNLESFEDTSMDISSILSTGLIDNGQKLSQLTDDWQEGIQTRSARKFLRSLSETKANSQNFNDLLDENLNEFFSLSTSLTDQSVAANLHCQNLISQSKKLRTVVRHWLDITDKSLTDCSSSNLKEVLDHVSAICALDKNRKVDLQLNKSNNIDLDISFAPKKAWISALFHIAQSYILADSSKTMRTLLISIKRTSNKTLLIITSNNFNSTKLNLLNSESKKHLQMANKTMKPFSASCENLFTTIGTNAPIALIWEHTLDRKLFSQTELKSLKETSLNS